MVYRDAGPHPRGVSGNSHPAGPLLWARVLWQTRKCRAGWWAEEASCGHLLDAPSHTPGENGSSSPGNLLETQDVAFAGLVGSLGPGGPVGILGVEGHLDPLNLVAEFGWRACLWLHALLYREASSSSACPSMSCWERERVRAETDGPGLNGAPGPYVASSPAQGRRGGFPSLRTW